MWIYNNHSEEDYRNAIKRVERIAIELGADYICTRKEKFAYYTGNKQVIEEINLNIYRYNDVYFDIEPHFESERPFIVLSFGDTPETTFDDAEPFPYNLSDEEMILEVKYSLGILPYPKF